MENKYNFDEIVDKHISGFHIYSLSNQFYLTFVSQSFCRLLGVEDSKLISKKDKYIKYIHNDDKEKYLEFLNNMSSKEQTLSIQYRLVIKNKIIFVNDTMSSKFVGDEKFGYSTLSDITEFKSEQSDFLVGKDNPCGFMKFTCSKQPQITYINKKMMEVLRIPNSEEDFDYLDLYKSNIYLIIPIEERKKFHHLLNRVEANNETITGELTILRCDGTRARVFGWITKQINEYGEEEFQSVSIDVSERYSNKNRNEVDLYVNSLSQVYDKIFEYDYANKKVKYLYGRNSKTFSSFKGLSAKMDEAVKQVVQMYVDKNDRERVQEFFDENYKRRFDPTDFKPLQIRFKAKFTDGVSRLYSGIFLKINLTTSLFCMKLLEDEDTSQLKSENQSLRALQDKLQNLIMRLTEGIVAFEIKQDRVKPLHPSENVCRFLGCSKEDLELMMQKKDLTIEELISKTEVLTKQNINKLLETGEADFPYFDVATQRNRKIKALCTQESIDDSQSRFVILYNVEDNEINKISSDNKVYIRTFGYFDVFVKDKAIAFKNKKSKELLALLVDRRGGFVTSEEAISFLWEDEDANSVTLARYRKVALRLKNILEEHGIADIIEVIDGKRRIDTSKVDCDLYHFLSGDAQYSQLFKGTYLTNYSWGETTLSELLGNYYN